jgi:hypothetical protein
VELLKAKGADMTSDVIISSRKKLPISQILQRVQKFQPFKEKPSVGDCNLPGEYHVNVKTLTGKTYHVEVASKDIFKKKIQVMSGIPFEEMRLVVTGVAIE